MPQPQAYHRPQTLEEAIQLVSRPGLNTAVLAGGTHLNPYLDGVEEIVDLQAAGLDEITTGESRFAMGAMVRIQAIVGHDDAPALLRLMARREGPNTFRNTGTVGGVIAAADPESELLAALLVYEAAVTIHSGAGAHTMPLADFLSDVRGHLRNGIITGLALETGGPTAHARVARTPADSPIVAAVARRRPDGDALLALCGLAATPILVDPDKLSDLDPPTDFRGSSVYRKEMARVLAKRVLNELQEDD